MPVVSGFVGMLAWCCSAGWRGGLAWCGVSHSGVARAIRNTPVRAGVMIFVIALVYSETCCLLSFARSRFIARFLCCFSRLSFSWVRAIALRFSLASARLRYLWATLFWFAVGSGSVLFGLSLALCSGPGCAASPILTPFKGSRRRLFGSFGMAGWRGFAVPWCVFIFVGSFSFK